MKTYLLVIKASSWTDGQVFREVQRRFPGYGGIEGPLRMNAGNWARVIITIEDYAAKSVYAWLVEPVGDHGPGGSGTLLWFNDVTKEANT